MTFSFSTRKRRGFSLVEVVLAIGIFALAIVALLGLLGPTLESVNSVREQNKATAIISKVNTFLQTYEPSLETSGETRSRFNYFYERLRAGGVPNEIILLAWFDDERPEGHYINFAEDALSYLNSSNFTGISDGVIFKVILEPSRFYQRYVDAGATYVRLANINGEDKIVLDEGIENYPEGFLAFSVSVLSGPVPPPGVAVDPNVYASSSTDVWTERLVYNTAINR